MSGTDWAVALAAAVAIAAVNWWFFGFDGRRDG
jgi:hypothetical protein